MSEATSRLESALAGRYRIERKLGEGGMASVYRAEDQKHERKVALKVLKPALAAVIGAERFLAEIKTTANLQHPHILALFDSGEADGFLYYVMPYIEGETLREKMDRERQLSIDEAVRITRDVADALDYAHRSEIIHRDIKPANILLHDGRPVVADFGIALAVSAAGGGRMTETGMSLGTPHYMSPEQASADRDLTARSDIYSLGCVLYEMLAGEPPHTGPSAQRILVNILTEEPKPLTQLRHTVPLNVAAAVMKAIEKLPADRFGSGRQFIDALGDSAFTHAGLARSSAGRAEPPGAPAGDDATRPRFRLSSLLPWGVAAVFAGLAARGAFTPEAERSTTRAALDVTAFTPQIRPGDLQISRDGQTFLVVADAGVFTSIGVRSADQADFHEIAGIEGRISTAVLSPAGDWIAYGDRDAGLMKVSVSGGASQPVIRDSSDTYYDPLDWGDDGQILVSVGGSDDEHVSVVPNTGGSPRRVVEGVADVGQLLPRSRVLLGMDGQARFVDLERDTSWAILEGALSPHFLHGSDQLLWVDETGAMWAAGFDPRSGTLAEERGIVLEGLTILGDDFARYSVSDDGTLVYSTGGSRGAGGDASLRLVTVWLDGRVEAEDLDPRPIHGPKWSPDGGFVAYAGAEARAASPDDRQIYTYDMQVKGRPRRLSETGFSTGPAWSPDGTRLVFASRAESGSAFDLYVKSVADDAPPRRLLSLPGIRWPSDWISPDRIIIQHQNEPWIVALPPEGSRDSAIARPFFESEDDHEAALLAPQGDLVTYSSNAGGGWEVYVRSFPVPGAPQRITEGGGDYPRWSGDGNAIYFLTDGDSLGIARIDRGPPLSVLDVSLVMPWPFANDPDLHPDGDRFITTQREEDATAEEGEARPDVVRFFVVTNWFEEMRARLAEGDR